MLKLEALGTIWTVGAISLMRFPCVYVPVSALLVAGILNDTAIAEAYSNLSLARCYDGRREGRSWMRQRAEVEQAGGVCLSIHIASGLGCFWVELTHAFDDRVVRRLASSH